MSTQPAGSTTVWAPASAAPLQRFDLQLGFPLFAPGRLRFDGGGAVLHDLGFVRNLVAAETLRKDLVERLLGNIEVGQLISTAAAARMLLSSGSASLPA